MLTDIIPPLQFLMFNGKFRAMRIYIHIGMHKTGTTSVQQTMLNNAVSLEALGYRVFVNLPQMNAKRGDCFNPAWLRDQVKIAEKDGQQAIIFSAEMVSTFNSQQLNSLLEAFYGYDMEKFRPNLTHR